MKLSGVMLAAACIALLCVPSHAEDRKALSANAMMQGCRNFMAESPQDRFTQGRCFGAVTALVEFGGPCPPSGGTMDQAVRIVITYIDARPARSHEEFNDLAREALMSAWPCR